MNKKEINKNEIEYKEAGLKKSIESYLRELNEWISYCDVEIKLLKEKLREYLDMPNLDLYGKQNMNDYNFNYGKLIYFLAEASICRRFSESLYYILRQYEIEEG
ncbi:MAG: hypothetical protein QHH15_00660 [Candidatus Thermoplasmatota archaeon]|jgi:hypothetical protein|nr:hypothetical protein [Candidatus Thermoplasmatota archaeon]